MSGISLRPLVFADRAEVAELIYLSTNAWYLARGRPAIFSGDPAHCDIFAATYEALDPGCCLLAVQERTGRIVGSCFFHPRPTHISVGIVNVHPNYFGRGVARRLLDAVIAQAERERKPVRLVSSAMNLDSFSLYTRAGFVPRQAFQDLILTVPDEGLAPHDWPATDTLRPATLADVPAMAALERELVGIEREKDYRHFLENRDGLWGVSVLEAADGSGLDGFLVSVGHPASNMLGPGVARTEEGAAALILAELNRRRGRTVVFLAPVDGAQLVARLYALGAKNCELHFAQIRGAWTPPQGVVLPTFLPETG